MRVGFQLSRHRLQEELVTADEVGLLEIKLHLLGRVQVVQDDEAVGGFVMGNISEVN